MIGTTPGHRRWNLSRRRPAHATTRSRQSAARPYGTGKVPGREERAPSKHSMTNVLEPGEGTPPTKGRGTRARVGSRAGTRSAAPDPSRRHGSTTEPGRRARQTRGTGERGISRHRLKLPQSSPPTSGAAFKTGLRTPGRQRSSSKRRGTRSSCSKRPVRGRTPGSHYTGAGVR